MNQINPNTTNKGATANREFAVLLALLLLFHVAWMKFLFPEQVYFIDYLQRVIAIGAFVWLVGWPKWRLRPIVWSIIAIALVTIAVHFSDLVLTVLSNVFGPFGARRFGFPPVQNQLLLWFDVTIGLALVAISEELIYRRLLHDQLARLSPSRWMIYLGSGLIFAGLHIIQGAQSALTAFIAGLLLMYLYRLTNSILAPVIAHYLINLWFKIDSLMVAEMNLNLPQPH